MDTTDTTDNSHQKVVNDYIKQIARQHEHVTHAREYRGSQIVVFIINGNFTKLQQLDYYFMYRSAIHESIPDHSYYSVHLLCLYIFLIIECFYKWIMISILNNAMQVCTRAFTNIHDTVQQDAVTIYNIRQHSVDCHHHSSMQHHKQLIYCMHN